MNIVEFIAAIVLVTIAIGFGSYLLIKGQFTLGTPGRPLLNVLSHLNPEPVEPSSWAVRFVGLVLLGVSGLIIYQLITGG